MAARILMHEAGADLVGMSEIASNAGVRPDTVGKWRLRHADFPVPIATLAMGPLWSWYEVEAWLAVERPPGRPRRAAPPAGAL
jgi:hypothetical protein